MSAAGRRRGLRSLAACLLAAWLGLLACERMEPHARPPREAVQAPPDEQSLAGAAVAVLDGQPILASDALPLLRGRDAADPSARRAAVEGVITRRLAAAEARRRGLQEDPSVRRQLDAIAREARVREESLLRDALFAHVRNGLAFSEAELLAHYEKTRTRYLERQLRLRRRAFPTPAEAEAAHAVLGAAGRLDAAGSEEIGPAPLRSLPPEVLPEVLKLEEPGARMVVVREGEAALVELVEVLPAEPPSFDAVRERVEQSLLTLRAQEDLRIRLAELRAAAQIAIDESALVDELLWTTPAEAAFPPVR